ncbi:MAG: dihydrolipoyl dehydrogenase [Deltaproteobacteria bacterium]|nr:dihydrolipoyl dehydrogenase [Deltaproteobacteria bacterium]
METNNRPPAHDSAKTHRTADVVVIGAGTAGLAAYRAATAVTANVLLIEGGTHGTTCARVGCMPSKLLLAAAEVSHHAAHGQPFGVNAQVHIDGRAVMDRVRRERDRFVSFVLDSVDRIPEAHKIHGKARFVGPRTVIVNNQTITAKSVVIATGSSPFVPPVLAAAGDRLVVNDDVFSWETLPSSVAVFGSGVIGLELGQALARLGVRVRIFGRSGTVGPLTDPVVKGAAQKAFEAEFPLHNDAPVSQVRRVDAGSTGEPGVEVTFTLDGEVRTEFFAYALVAAGRRPNLGKLGLEATDLSLDEHGVPVFDRSTLQCGNTPIFIAGDANHDIPLLHEAADEGKIAGENAARFPKVVPGPRRSPLSITFTDPQLAVVGANFATLSECLAAQGGPVIGSVSFEDQGRSRVMLQNRGACRVYADPSTGRFLGAEMAGPRAENIGHLLAWAHQQDLTIDRMLSMPFYHPVVEEGIRTALRDASAQLVNRANAAVGG